MIDLRSDTVTKPSPEMLEVMLRAPVGDDVYGEDPTVNALEELAARMTGKEAALFVASGTQGNLLALLSHCQRGDEYIAGQDAHTYRYEAGGAAVLGSLQPQPLPFNEAGELPVDAVLKAVKPDDYHFARTRLVCLENTQAGKVLSMDYLADFAQRTAERGLARHLDGARVFNAAVKLDLPVADICQYFDSISICLSKGLACPVGSVLVGDQALITDARRWRKMLGGGMRQAGLLAAAGIHALNHHVTRLAEDHENATRLAEGLLQLPGFNLKTPPQTNMVMLDLSEDVMAALQLHLQQQQIVISGPRWVTHRDVTRQDIDEIIEVCSKFSQL